MVRSRVCVLPWGRNASRDFLRIPSERRKVFSPKEAVSESGEHLKALFLFYA